MKRTASDPLCPLCARAATPAFRPFCSRRCADIDLSRWLSEAYAIPVQETDWETDWTEEAASFPNTPQSAAADMPTRRNERSEPDRGAQGPKSPI